MASPKSSIDWKRRFTLPVVLGLNEGDLPSGDFDTYFSNAGVNARRVQYLVLGFAPGVPRELRQAGTANVFLLPRSSRARAGASVTPITVDEGKIRAALRTTQYQGDLPDDIQAAVELESQRIHVIFEDYRSELLPLPLVPENAVTITWPVEPAQPWPALINATFDGVAPDVNGALTFPASPTYLFKTSNTMLGELDPYWVRAPFTGMVRFQRYFHLKKTGANLQGRNPSNSGRVVAWDPEPAHLADDATAENRVTRTITALAFEGVDAGYKIASPDIGLTMDASQLTHKPAIAEAYKLVLIFHLSHYARIRAAQGNPALASVQTGLSPLLFGLVSKTLTRLLRCWVAYSSFIQQPAWTPTLPDAALMAALQTSAPVTEDILEQIVNFLSADVAHWKRLMGFVDVIFTPFYLGATWRSLGVPASQMPTSSRGAGWWKANLWAWEALNGLGLYNQNWLVVYAGCPLARPSAFYKADQIQNPVAIDDEERLVQGEGLGAQELEALTLAGLAQTALGLMNAPSQPSNVAQPVDLEQFDTNKIGYALSLRTYRVEVAPNAAIQTLPVATTDWLADLLVGIDGGRPVLEFGPAFQHHPFVDSALFEISRAFSIRSLRTDGNQTSLKRNDVIEYRAVHGSLVGETAVTRDRVELKVTLTAADGTAQPYVHFRAGSAAADATFQTSPPGLTIEARMLLPGWTIDEAVELFLSLHPLDYERFILLLHDPAHTETVFCGWHVAIARADGKVDVQQVKYSLLFDLSEIAAGTAAATLSLPTAAPPGQTFPQTFQHKVVTGFGIPPNTNLTQAPASVEPDTLTSRRVYLNSQTVTRAEDGLALLTAYLSRADTQAKRIGIDNNWHLMVSNAGDNRPNALGAPRSGFATMFFMMVEAETDPAFSRGIMPEFVKATFHQRIRIVHRAYERYRDYLAVQGVPGLQFPVEVMWALYRLEGPLGVPPGVEMLQRGIPPIQREPQKIKVHQAFVSWIPDLIVRGSTFPSANVTAGSAKPAIDQARQSALMLYHLNLIAMDIYLGPDFNDRELERFSFVKTYLATRQDLDLAITADHIRQAFEAYYQMLGLLVACNKGVSFTTVRDPVEMTTLWLHEAMIYLTAMRRGQAIMGHGLTHPLPPRLSYLRFNYGDVSFWRIVNILVVQTLDNIGALAVAGFPVPIQPFLQRVRDDLVTDLTAPVVARLRAMANLTGQLSGNRNRRMDDTDADRAVFRAVENKLVSRTTLTAADAATLSGVIPGTREAGLLASLNMQTAGRYGEIDALVAWLDTNDLWEGLDAWFGTLQLDDLLIAFITASMIDWRRDNLFQYENARLFGHYVNGFHRIFI